MGVVNPVKNARQPKKQKIPLAVVGLFLVFFLLAPHGVSAADNLHYYRGRVLKIREFVPEFFMAELAQEAEVVITSGPHRGKRVTVINYYSEQEFYLKTLIHEGQEVILAVEEENGELLGAELQDIARDRWIWILVGVFLLALLAVGRWKGAKTIITLILSTLVLFRMVLPLLLRGYEPIPIAILGSAAIIVCTLFIVGGFNLKSVVAILGTTSGIGIAGLLALWVGRLADLTGFSTHEAQMLFLIEPPLNVRGLLFAGIIIGSLGAITDVGMSVASAAAEIKKVNPSIDSLHLARSALNVGRDIMGTMANTLLLAYVGGATPLLLLLMAHGGGSTWNKILNLDLIATEFVRGLSGSIGLVLSIPVTAALAGFLMGNPGHVPQADRKSKGTQRFR